MSKGVAKPRVGHKILFDEVEKAKFDDYVDRQGMKHGEVLTRLVHWFMAEDDVLRKAILRTLPEGMEIEISKMALKRIADGVYPRLAATKKTGPQS